VGELSNLSAMYFDILFGQAFQKILNLFLAFRSDAYQLGKGCVSMRAPIRVQTVAHLVWEHFEQVPQFDRYAWIHVEHAQ
jgi:hypothetical protein